MVGSKNRTLRNETRPHLKEQHVSKELVRLSNATPVVYETSESHSRGESRDVCFVRLTQVVEVRGACVQPAPEVHVVREPEDLVAVLQRNATPPGTEKRNTPGDWETQHPRDWETQHPRGLRNATPPGTEKIRLPRQYVMNNCRFTITSACFRVKVSQHATKRWRFIHRSTHLFYMNHLLISSKVRRHSVCLLVRVYDLVGYGGCMTLLAMEGV